MLSNFKARVDSNHPTSKIGIGHTFESSIFDEAGELFLFGELSDAFYEVLVRLTVVGKEFTQAWDHVEGIEIVELFEDWDFHF